MYISINHIITHHKSTNTERLRIRTHRVLYERYRKVQLKKMGFEDNDPESEPARWASREYW